MNQALAAAVEALNAAAAAGPVPLDLAVALFDAVVAAKAKTAPNPRTFAERLQVL